MSWARPFLSLLVAAERLLDRVLCVLGAIIASQAPEFFQQYLQRLGGHLDEARHQLAQLRTAAQQSGLSVDQLAARAAGAADPALARLGGVIRRLVERVDALSQAETALRTAPAWDRPFVFGRYFDPEIARATWAVFRPAVPTTVEGAVYAAAGMLLMLALYHGGVKGACRAGARAWRRRREGLRPPPTAAADSGRLR